VRVRAIATVLAVALGLSGCSVAGARTPAAPDPGTTRPSAALGTPAVATRTRPPDTAPASRTTTATPARRPSGQLITVIAPSYGATQAELTAYRLAGGHWRRVFGPWVAWIGRNGMAPPGAKREGDGRTPSGTYRFGFFFGVDPNPGVRFPYRPIGPADYWDDDPASPDYNEWVDDQDASPGAAPEPMDVPAYDYGAVIAYNTARTPGLGSAIFLHINIGTPTAGCVTLPAGELLEILRWLRPKDSPRITMRVGAPGSLAR
jgi:L,D-peptidoglycan transpeptidase YkuD (ErfK/YbiS/YcfS/YnhG family)